MTNLEKMRNAQIRLNAISYNQAISHYKILYNQFIKDYAQFKNQTIQESIKELQNNIFSKLVNLDKTIGLSASLLSKIQTIIIDKLQGNDNLIQEANNAQLEYEKNKQKGRDFAQSLILKSLLSDDKINQLILQELSIKNNINGLDLTNIKNFLFGYGRKLILSANRERETIYSHLYPTAGFLQEAIGHLALAEIFNNINIKWPGAIMSGEIKVKNVDTAYDEWLSFLSAANLSFEKNIAIEDQNNFFSNIRGYGIQSKLYSKPWESKNDLGSVGSRSVLLQMFFSEYSTYSWVEGVEYLSYQVPEVLGKYNVGYIFGNGFEWTYSMIQKYWKNKYYLAFEFNKQHKATKKVSWQKFKQGRLKW